MSQRRRIVSVLKTVEEVDEELRKALKWVEERAARLLTIADEGSRTIKMQANSLVERALEELRRVFEEEASKIEREFEERMRKEIESVKSMAEANREKAVEEAARKLAEVIMGGRG